jgi:hypothetical protein
MHGNMNVKFIADGFFWYISVCILLSFFKFMDSVKVPCFVLTLTSLPTRNTTLFPYLVQCEKCSTSIMKFKVRCCSLPCLQPAYPKLLYRPMGQASAAGRHTNHFKFSPGSS